MSQLRDPRAVPALSSALKDKNDEVREQAIFALSQIRDVNAVPALTPRCRIRSRTFAAGRVRDEPDWRLEGGARAGRGAQGQGCRSAAAGRVRVEPDRRRVGHRAAHGAAEGSSVGGAAAGNFRAVAAGGRRAASPHPTSRAGRLRTGSRRSPRRRRSGLRHQRPRRRLCPVNGQAASVALSIE